MDDDAVCCGVVSFRAGGMRNISLPFSKTSRLPRGAGFTPPLEDVEEVEEVGKGEEGEEGEGVEEREEADDDCAAALSSFCFPKVSAGSGGLLVADVLPAAVGGATGWGRAIALGLPGCRLSNTPSNTAQARTAPLSPQVTKSNRRGQESSVVFCAISSGIAGMTSWVSETATSSSTGTSRLCGGGGSGSGSAERFKSFKIRAASAPRVSSSRVRKASGSDENNSNSPTNSPSRRSGMTMIERTPSCCEASKSTRRSAQASSQHCVRRVRMHSPDSPDAASSREPSSGAVEPLLARHTISPSRSSAMAAPVAPVVRQACSTTSLSTISRARSVESSGDRPPPLCVAKRAASWAKSVSKWASSGWARSTPVALRLGFDGSGCGVGDWGMTGQQHDRITVRSGVSPENSGLSIRFVASGSSLRVVASASLPWGGVLAGTQP